MADSISVEQLQEQQKQLLQTVNNLISQKSQLEDQLENCKATLSSNQGALQYANALIQSCAESTDVDNVGDGNIAEEIETVRVDDAAVEEVEL
tara:strand:- start:18 stop:296 length:279 start_codon:yes stop_codon:yes gene_type:complete